MSEEKSLRLSELFTEAEYNKLCNYVAYHVHKGFTTINRLVGDFCATQPQIMERINKHGILFSYFCYVIEAVITGAISPVSEKEPTKDQSTKEPEAPKTDEPKQ